MSYLMNWMRPASVAISVVVALFATGALAQASGDDRIVVPLTNGSVTLSRGAADGLPERLASQLRQRSILFDRALQSAPLIITSDDPATTLGALAELGLQPVDRLATHAFVVQATSESLDALTGLAGASAIDLMPATAKIAADVNRTQPFEWQRRDGGLAYSVQVYPGTKAEEIEAIQERGLVLALEEYDRSTVEIVRVFTVVLDPDNIRALAELPFVARIEPAPSPDEQFNEDSTQPLSNVDDVQIAPYNLSGAGINVGVWEAGTSFGIRNTHESLSGRVTVEEASGFSDHATHVSGTIASNGTTAGTEGMAPASSLASYGSGSDATEMTAAATSAGGAGDPLPIVISNHSYGLGAGWSGNGATFGPPNQNTQALFGQYTNLSAGFDNVVIGTDLIVVQAAGNDRNDTWNGASADPSIPCLLYTSPSPRDA